MGDWRAKVTPGMLHRQKYARCMTCEWNADEDLFTPVQVQVVGHLDEKADHVVVVIRAEMAAHIIQRESTLDGPHG